MAYRRRGSLRGRHCTRYKRVRVRGAGVQRRCAKYSGSHRASSTKRHRGRRPFNKGKHCVEYGVGKHGKVVCRSYGKVYGGKVKNRRRTRPGSSPVGAGTYANRIRSRAAAAHNTPETRYGFPVSEGIPSWWAA